MNADGKAPLNVTDNEDIADADPSWTPDGRILFTSERAATLGIQATDLRGARSHHARKAPAPSRYPSGRPTGHASRSCRSGRAGHTSTCSDGRRRATATADAGSAVRRHVSDVVARRATHRLRSRGRVRHGLPLHDECRRHRCALPARGRGSVLSRVVARRHAPRPRAELRDRRRRPNGQGQRLVTAGGINSSPTWSPDGRWIAFASDRDDEDDSDIFVVAATAGLRGS